MRSQNLKPVTNIAAAILVAGLITTAIVPPAFATQTQVMSNGSASSTTIPAETDLSSAAAKVLRHIAQARDDLAQGDTQAADRELAKALNSLDIADASLGDNERNKAKAELDAAGSSLVYREVDLPLNATRQLVVQARELASRNNIAGAQEALQTAQNNAFTLSIVVHEPLIQAHHSLWQATQDYAAGAYSAAKAQIDRAAGYLDAAADKMDKEAQRAAKRLADQARSLERSVETGSDSVPSELEDLWRRAGAMSERSVEQVIAAWRLDGAKSVLKRDLIQAKLHLSYAEIDRFTALDADDAEEELGMTLMYLDGAIDHAQEDRAREILAIREGVNWLVEDPAAAQQDSMYAELKTRLSQMIEAL